MAWYRTGTIGVTNGTTAVIGSGTAFVANVSVGEAVLAPDGRLYEVSAVVSDTSLTLASAYLGTTQSGQAYVIVPTQGFIRDLANQAAALVNNYSTLANTTGAGKFADGTVALPGITFANDADTGLWRSGANVLEFVAGGGSIAKIDTTGLSIQDGRFKITGSADATKIAVFEVDGFTPATTRTFTLPNASTTLVGEATTQTLTGKTLNLTSNTLLATSAQLATAVTDETGSGALVFATSPTLVTPALGTPASGTLTNCTGLPVAGGGTGRATGTTAFSLVATGTTATGPQQTLANGLTTEILVGGGASALPIWTTATGSGAPVRATSPTLTTPTFSGGVTNGLGTQGYAATLGEAPESAARFADLGTAVYADLVTLVKTSIPRTITTATAVVQDSDTWLIINFAGTCTLTLPTASLYPGKCYTIKTITANTVASASGNVVPLVGGAAGTAILAATAGKWARLVSDGSSWQTMEAA